MVCQPLDLFGEPVGIKRLDGPYDPGMEDPPLLLLEAPIDDLVRERMLEGVAPRSPVRACVSTSVWMLSSRNKGFPSVSSMRRRVSGMTLASCPRMELASAWADAGGSESSRSWL
jgi:hypothetical protein